MKRGSIFAVIAAALLLVGLPVFSVGTARAATTDGLSLVTSPLPIKLVATPGTSVSADIRVKNNGTATEHLSVGLMKFTALGEEGRPNLADRGPNDSYFDWVSFSPGDFQAPPNQWVNVKMTIKVPKTADLGYYYAVTFQRARPGPNSGQQTAVVGATATMVLLEVKTGHENRKLELATFTSDHKVYQYLPATFSVRVHNTGNIHLSPAGSIFIKKGDKTIGTLNLNPFQGSVLPNSYRVFQLDWTDGAPHYVDKQVAGKPLLHKDGSPQRSLSWDGVTPSKLRFGHYTAQLLLVYNDGAHDVPYQATLSFWVIPWNLIALALAVVIAPALLVYLAMRLAGRKRNRVYRPSGRL